MSDPGVGIRGHQLGRAHFKVLRQSFLNIHISVTTGKKNPYLEHNHIIPLHLITKHYTPGSSPGLGPMGKKLGHTNF